MSSVGNMEVYQIPEESQMYRLRAMGRRVLPESDEQHFVIRVDNAMGESCRDYRGLVDWLIVVAEERGYSIVEGDNVYEVLRRLLLLIHPHAEVSRSARSVLFTDLVVFAIKACPDTDRNIY